MWRVVAHFALFSVFNPAGLSVKTTGIGAQSGLYLARIVSDFRTCLTLLLEYKLKILKIMLKSIIN